MADIEPAIPEADDETCAYCELQAAYRCDFAIGGRIAGFIRSGPIDRKAFIAICDANQPMYRCDMPLCEDHRVRVGAIFAHGTQGYHDTIDRCPEHLGASDREVVPITDDEALSERRAIRAAARRRLFRCVDEA